MKSDLEKVIIDRYLSLYLGSQVYPIIHSNSSPHKALQIRLLPRINMFPKPPTQRLIASQILLLDSLILEVSSRAHPAMDLRPERLDMLLNRESLIERLDVFGLLLLGREHTHRDRDLSCVFAGYERWVALCCYGPGSGWAGG